MNDIAWLLFKEFAPIVVLLGALYWFLKYIMRVTTKLDQKKVELLKENNDLLRDVSEKLDQMDRKN